MKNIVISALLLVLLGLASCKQNNYHININDIELDFSIIRIENKLFGVDPANLSDDLETLKQKYPGIIRYLGYVLNLGEVSNPDWNNLMISFATDRQNVEVYNVVREMFPDLAWIEEELIEAWKHYTYYFPTSEVPSIYTCTSGFNSSQIIGESEIGISLDRYLGSESKFYAMLGIYSYQQKWMIPEKIVSDCIYAWASSSWVLEDTGETSTNLLQTMMHEGRLLFFTRSMLPEHEDTLLFGFDKMQLKFAENNEQQMWAYLIEHDMLFSTDPMVINKLCNEAPFTSYFTRESPGKAGNWIGFRIVESFMKRNPDVSLGDLMEMEDLRSVLELSKYSPK